MKNPRYQIASADSSDQLEVEVAKLIDADWQLHGPTLIHKDRFYQALIRGKAAKDPKNDLTNARSPIT